jgi:hypothetical protein
MSLQCSGVKLKFIGKIGVSLKDSSSLLVEWIVPSIGYKKLAVFLYLSD